MHAQVNYIKAKIFVGDLVNSVAYYYAKKIKYISF